MSPKNLKDAVLGSMSAETDYLKTLQQAGERPFAGSPTEQAYMSALRNLPAAQQAPVNPQYGAGGLGALGGLGAALQGPQAVARQGQMIQSSANTRAQQIEANTQRQSQRDFREASIRGDMAAEVAKWKEAERSRMERIDQMVLAAETEAKKFEIARQDADRDYRLRQQNADTQARSVDLTASAQALRQEELKRKADDARRAEFEQITLQMGQDDALNSLQQGMDSIVKGQPFVHPETMEELLPAATENEEEFQATLQRWKDQIRLRYGNEYKNVNPEALDAWIADKSLFYTQEYKRNFGIPAVIDPTMEISSPGAGMSRQESLYIDERRLSPDRNEATKALTRGLSNTRAFSAQIAEMNRRQGNTITQIPTKVMQEIFHSSDGTIDASVLDEESITWVRDTFGFSLGAKESVVLDELEVYDAITGERSISEAETIPSERFGGDPKEIQRKVLSNAPVSFKGGRAVLDIGRAVDLDYDYSNPNSQELQNLRAWMDRPEQYIDFIQALHGLVEWEQGGIFDLPEEQPQEAPRMTRNFGVDVGTIDS